MNVIHWYPGHMKKASNEMLLILKTIDVVVELVDARAPTLTQNPFFQKIIKNKPHLVVYMKSDLADLSKIKLKENELLVSLNNKKSIVNLLKKIILANEIKIKKAEQKGIKPEATKAMIIGIPNVGKSSLINALMGKRITKVENRPGLTKNHRWINVNKDLYLLDTPGILPTDYLKSNFVLGLIGSIKIELLPIVELSEFAYHYIVKYYPQLFIKRYHEIKSNSEESFKHIANIRGIKNDPSLNHERARALFLKEIRDGDLGPLYFEMPC